VPGGRRSVDPFVRALEDTANNLPDPVREVDSLYLDRITQTASEIAALERRIEEHSRKHEVAQRLRTIPGVGPVTAMAIEAFALALETFQRGRDFSAWLGLVPRQHSSGGKQRLGRTSKMGQRDIRRLLISGAILLIHWMGRNGGKPGSWLTRMLPNKPRMVWAIMTRKEVYRDPEGTVC